MFLMQKASLFRSAVREHWTLFELWLVRALAKKKARGAREGPISSWALHTKKNGLEPKQRKSPCNFACHFKQFIECHKRIRPTYFIEFFCAHAAEVFLAKSHTSVQKELNMHLTSFKTLCIVYCPRSLIWLFWKDLWSNKTLRRSFLRSSYWI